MPVSLDSRPWSSRWTLAPCPVVLGYRSYAQLYASGRCPRAAFHLPWIRECQLTSSWVLLIQGFLSLKTLGSRPRKPSSLRCPLSTPCCLLLPNQGGSLAFPLRLCVSSPGRGAGRLSIHSCYLYFLTNSTAPNSSLLTFYITDNFLFSSQSPLFLDFSFLKYSYFQLHLTSSIIVGVQHSD